MRQTLRAGLTGRMGQSGADSLDQTAPGGQRGPVDVMLDIDASGGRRRGLERALRAAIRDGRLALGETVPSSRQLAADLGLARGTVVDAYEQLAVEGYLSTRPRGRTVVAATAPEAPRRPDGPRPGPPAVDLRAGAPDLSSFPAGEWTATVRDVLRRGPLDALDYPPAAGRPEIRAAVASYLARARGVVADPDQVVVTSGFGHGLEVVTRALVATGRRRVAMEDPCLPFHREIAAAAGAEVVPVPVDDRGVDIAAVAAAGVGAVVVTPARQAILGATLAPDRRGALVAWARSADAVVVEDDYDGELRFDRDPVGAVQGLDPGRVVYLGTTSKSLAPGLRLAWAVVPAALALEVDAALGFHGQVSSLDQLVVAELIESHALDRHLRRVRPAYRRRRDRLVAVLAERVPAVRVEGVAAGLQALVQWPAARAGQADVEAEATTRGIALTGVARAWASGPPRFPGLLVGYGRPPQHDVERCVAALADLLADTVG
jgi:GntR family transcriptional regulator/MocR family aminotransferase